ncbi:MAG: PAS domain S-box protein [Deltaproteobacteria bacterium]|nr:PAS domain S-box protein [Deltaproteobacteria bacterium]
MSDDQKSKADLIEELTTLRRQLKTSEVSCSENLSTVIRDSVDGILVVDPKGVVLFANPAAERILMRPSAEMLGTTLGVPTVESDSTEMDLLMPEGDSVPVELRSNKTVWEGQPAIYVALRDLTERRNAEAALRESEAKYRALFETMAQGVLYFNAEGKFVSANPAARRMLGLPPDQFIGMDAGDLRWRLVQEDGSDFPVENLPSRIAFRTGRKVSNVVIGFKNAHDDTRRWIRVNATPQFKPGEERPFQVYATVEDITESKKAFDRTQRLASIVQSTGNAIISKTLDGTITTWNPAAERMYGYCAEEAIGRNIAMLVPDEAKADLEKTLEGIRRGDRVANYETVRRGKDGTLIDVSLTVSPIHDEAGHVVGSSAIAQDISQLKRAVAERQVMEEQFHQSQKLESIGRLAGGVAHDFNNMLNVILGYGELMLTKLQEADPLWEYTREVVEAGKRAAALTRQLLAFSRKQTLQPRVLNLNDIISNLEKMLGRLIGEDIRLTTALAEDLCRVEVDPGQIEQVIMNIAVNARDAMPQGGVLTIETRNAALDARYAQDHISVVPGDYLLLAMTDNGCGMDETTREKLFEPFFTTKEKGKGTGLGLATVYGIIKQSKGYIWVYSEPGKGTAFKIYLPCTATPQSSREVTAVPEETRGSGQTILVVEDEAALRKLCAAVLKKAGYQVLVAGNGGEALLMIEEKKAQPDLVLTDVVMPEMSGKILVDRLRKTLPHIRVLFMSGYTDDAIVPHGVLDADIPFIEKPFNTRALINKIGELLRK